MALGFATVIINGIVEWRNRPEIVIRHFCSMSPHKIDEKTNQMPDVSVVCHHRSQSSISFILFSFFVNKPLKRETYWLKSELDTLMFAKENENSPQQRSCGVKKRRNMLNYHFPSHSMRFFPLSVYKFNYRCHHSTWLETQWFFLSLSPLRILRLNVNVMSASRCFPVAFSSGRA